MAFGLPVEGEDAPFLGEHLVEEPTCDVSLTVAEARKVLDESGADVVIVVADGGLAIGAIDGDSLEGQDDKTGLLDVLRPVPSTVRPSVTVSSVADAGGGSVLVTDSDGRLLGRAVIEPGDHHDHDHAGHDHGDSAGDEERYEQEFATVLKAVEERFGDREPSAEELRAFLRERLVAEGRSAEEADEMLEQLDAAEDG